MTLSALDSTVGDGDFRYRPVEGWGTGPDGHELGLVASLAVDSRDRVYVFNREPDPAMLVFDRDGRFLSSWGQDTFTTPHSIWIDADDVLWLTDMGDHTLRKCTSDGQVLQTWGTPGKPGEPGMPFNKPSWAMTGPSGSLYVTDGYGQSRVHKFAPSGELERSWGEPGSGPGQFNLPHAIWVDDDERLLVVDRENHRIQVFDSNGTYLTEWTGFSRPQGIHVRDEVVYIAEARPGVRILTLEGEQLAHWTNTGNGPGQFRQYPHSLWIDSHGDIYVSEVTGHGLLQKFERV